MINLDPLLKELPNCVHSVLDPASTKNASSQSIIVKKDNSKTTLIDIELQKKLQDLLKIHFPSFSAWGEESFLENFQLDSDNLNQGEHWVIDPIDGTTNFINNVPAFCTTMSLIVDGEIIAGITYDPNRKELFHTIKSKGVYFNHNKVRPSKQPESLKQCIAALDFKRLNASLRKKIVSQQPYYSQRNFGSSGIEWAWLSINRVNFYLHGSQCLWDYACGFLSIQELGGEVSSLAGDSLETLTLDKRSVVASQSPRLHEQLLKMLQE